MSAPPDEVLAAVEAAMKMWEREHPCSILIERLLIGLQAADALGWVLVPRHMPSAERHRQANRYGLSHDIVHDIYDTSVAMLAAAPKVGE